MRLAKHLLMAAVLAASTLAVGATPRPAAAETTVASAAFVIPDGQYPVYDGQGHLIGYITIKGGVVVKGDPPT